MRPRVEVTGVSKMESRGITSRTLTPRTPHSRRRVLKIRGSFSSSAQPVQSGDGAGGCWSGVDSELAVLISPTVEVCADILTSGSSVLNETFGLEAEKSGRGLLSNSATMSGTSSSSWLRSSHVLSSAAHPFHSTSMSDPDLPGFSSSNLSTEYSS